MLIKPPLITTEYKHGEEELPRRTTRPALTKDLMTVMQHGVNIRSNGADEDLSLFNTITPFSSHIPKTCLG